MDRMLYVAMSGAKQIAQAQTANAHNLANVSTPGFRADLHAFSSMAVAGPGFPSRVNAMLGSAGSDFSAGPVMHTGNDLDVAVAGSGWIAVQAPDGGEAYTRRGDLHVTSGGIIATGDGHPVIGEGGPVAVPPDARVTIGTDGTVSIVPIGESATTVAAVDRIKLVDPLEQRLVKDRDGLHRAGGGKPIEADASVQLKSGELEGSNVSTMREMVAMIELSRQWEMNVKVMETAQQNAAAATGLISLS